MNEFRFEELLIQKQKKVMDKWEFYQDAKKEWRWRRVAPNGRIVGASSQGYVNKSDCIENARRNGYTG